MDVPPCKHGIQPNVTQEFVEIGMDPYMNTKIPGPYVLRYYDCPTESECIHNTIEIMRAKENSHGL